MNNKNETLDVSFIADFEQPVNEPAIESKNSPEIFSVYVEWQIIEHNERKENRPAAKEIA